MKLLEQLETKGIAPVEIPSAEQATPRTCDILVKQSAH